MATTTSDLNRLYDMLTEKVGFPRIRDVRLEKIAADRALEMRYQQGLVYNSNNPIKHQYEQLSARVFPWESTKGTTENALWHYYPPTWVNHIVGAVDFTFPDDPDTYGDLAGKPVGWWNSTIHRNQLLDSRWTHWGHGIHYEDTNLGARRWYFITVFSTDLEPLKVRSVIYQPGKWKGFHLTAGGKIIHRKVRNFTSPKTGIIDDRMQVPGRGPMVHAVSSPFNHRWIDDDDRIVWREADV